MKIDSLNKNTQVLIETPLNKILANLITQGAGYGTDTAKFIKVLLDKRMCKYQSTLLKKYLKYPQKYLELEIDKLDFTASYNKKATKVFKAIICPKKGILQVQPQHKNLISVEEVRLDSINIGCHKDQKNRPKYTQKYEVRIKGKVDAVLSLYVADGSKGKYRGLRFSLNPRHFSQLDLAAAFMHIHKVLGATEYKNAIAKAIVTRVDVAVNLPGVSPIFLLFMPPHGNSTRSSCFPEKCGAICETLYIGPVPSENDLDRTRRSKYRIYCWLLNKLKNGKRLPVDKYVVAARLEYELNCWDNQRGLKVTELANALVKLDQLSIIDPLDFYRMPEKWHKELLVNKTIANMRKRIGAIERKLEKHDGFKLLSLNSRWLRQEQSRLLTNLTSTIQAPKSVFKECQNEA